MVYETFLKTIHAMVQSRLEGQAQVSLRQVLKNNGLLLDGLTISTPSSRLAPTVYLNAYYDEAERGLPLSAITEQILLLCEEEPQIPDEIGEQLRHFPSVRSRIAYKLINAGENELLLSSLPHFRYLDLAIVFYIIVAENSSGQMTALIHHDHLHMWGITREELGQLAEENTPRLLPWQITPLEEAIAQIDQDGAALMKSLTPVQLYVLTNDRGINGASCLLYPHVLKDFAEQAEDDLIVLPSSIHEVLLAPCGQALPLGDINEMIQAINQSDVPADERLANHAYCYSRSQNCLYLPSTDFSSSAAYSDGTENPQ